MGIRFQCPNGCKLNVKEKYSGRKCYCPSCPGKVVVRVPEIKEEDLIFRDFSTSVLGPDSSASISGDFEFYNDKNEKSESLKKVE